MSAPMPSTGPGGLPSETTVIAAVGRSGTTIMHRLLLEIYADRFGQAFDTLYEPFVWDSDVIGHYPKDKAREEQFGREEALSQEGLYLHTKLPLFTDGDQIGDAESIARRYLKADPTRPLLAKFIRANGRLGLLDKLYPNARFLICLRNPFDVVNSVLTKFSFFGAEFHKNDYPRFAADVARTFGVTLPPEVALTPAYKAALWCHFMNAAAFEHAAGKNNYRVVVYEDFAAHRAAYARIICEHVGAPFKPVYEGAVAQSVGRVSKAAPVLSALDAAQIMPLLDSYLALAAASPRLGEVSRDDILRRYSSLGRQATYVSRGFGWSPVKLESEIVRQRENAQQAEQARRLQLADVQRRMLQATADVRDIKIGISAIVTSFNNERTLRETLESVRRQSYPVSEIIVADDASTDGSRVMLENLAKEEPRLRLLLRDTNVGVSANRNDAIRQAQQPFVVQIDGDDLFHATKLEREVRALQGRDDSVAFSDTLRQGPEEYWDCSWAVGLNGRAMISGLASRRGYLPRDMLLSRDLFFSAGGYRDGCNIYEDWGFKIRLAEKARHWLYSGGPGTLYSPGGLSHVGRINHLYGGLWILTHDVDGVLAANRCWTAALAGLLRLMRIEPDAAFNDDRLEDAIGPKVQTVFEMAKHQLLSRPVSDYVGDENKFLDKLKHLLKVLGITVA